MKMDYIIAPSDVRAVLDELNLAHQKCDENVYRVPLPVFNEIKSQALAYVCVLENKVQIQAMVPGFGVEISRRESLEIVNAWNCARILPKVCVKDDGEIIAVTNYYLSKDCIFESQIILVKEFIDVTFQTIAEFFNSLNRTFYPDDELTQGFEDIRRLSVRPECADSDDEEEDDPYGLFKKHDEDDEQN